MRGRKCVAYIVVGQRRERAHDQGLGLLFMAQLERALKQSLFLGDKPDVVQQQDLALLEVADGLLGRRAAYVGQELDRRADQALQHFGVRPQRIEILVFDVAALVGQHDGLCALVVQFAQGGRTAADARVVGHAVGRAVDRLVDIHAHDDRLAAHRQGVQRIDSKFFHGALLPLCPD